MRDRGIDAQPLPYALFFQIDFGQAINANQGLIILTQKEKGEFGTVLL